MIIVYNKIGGGGVRGEGLGAGAGELHVAEVGGARVHRAGERDAGAREVDGTSVVGEVSVVGVVAGDGEECRRRGHRTGGRIDDEIGGGSRVGAERFGAGAGELHVVEAVPVGHGTRDGLRPARFVEGGGAGIVGEGAAS